MRLRGAMSRKINVNPDGSSNMPMRLCERHFTPAEAVRRALFPGAHVLWTFAAAAVFCSSCSRPGEDNRTPAYPRLSAVEAVVIGADEKAPFVLTQVTGIVLLPNGHMYVIMAGESEVLHFDDGGRFVRRLGRAGEGPGEFQRIQSAGFVGDTIWVSDAARSVVSYFAHPADSLTREVWFDGSRVHEDFGRLRPVGILSNGAMLVSSEAGVAYQGVGKLAVARIAWHRVAADRSAVDSVFEIALPGVGVWFDGGGGNALYVSAAFGDAPLTAVAADGATIVVVDRKIATSARSAELTVTHLAVNSGRKVSRRYGYGPIASSRYQMDSLLRRKLGRDTTSPDWRRQFESLREHAGQPPFWPYVRSVYAEISGGVWLELWDEPGRYLMVDGSGSARGIVVFDPGFRLLAADQARGVAWGTRTDGTGVPLVIRYDIPDWR